MHAFTWLAKRKETGTDGYTWEEGRKRSIQVCVIKKKKRGEKICIYLYRYAIFEEKTFLVYVLYLFVCKKQIDEEEEEEERCRGKVEMREREKEKKEKKKENDSLYTEIFRPTRFHRSTTTTGNESFHLRILAFWKGNDVQGNIAIRCFVFVLRDS